MELNCKTASILLALVIAARAVSFMFSKICLSTMNAFNLLSVCGIALLSLKGQTVSFSSGERYLLCAALFYASAIIVTNRLTACGDPFNMGFFQVCTIAFLGTVSASLSGRYTLPVSVWQYVMIFLLAVVCTCFGFTLQPVAQSRIPSDKAALFCAINPFVASILGVVFLHENFTIFTISGELMILAALILR